jgi:hypothetical protein
MIITKIFSFRLDMDTKMMYSSNYNQSFLDELNSKYAGRCYLSMFILEFVQIIKRGEPMAKAKVLDGSMYCDLLVEARGTAYEKMEIAHNCKIVHIEKNGDMIGLSEDTFAHIKNVQKTNIYKVDDVVPLIVCSARYRTFAERMNVAAVPIMPIKKDLVFYRVDMASDMASNTSSDGASGGASDTSSGGASGSASNHDQFAALIANILADVAAMEQQIAEFRSSTKNKAICDVHVKMLYPIAKYRDPNTIVKCTAMKIKDLPSLGHGQVVFRPDVYLTDDSVFVVKDEQKIPEDSIVLSMPYHELAHQLIYEYKKDLHKLLGFLSAYGTVDKIREMDPVWKFYAKSKAAI